MVKKAFITWNMNLKWVMHCIIPHTYRHYGRKMVGYPTKLWRTALVVGWGEVITNRSMASSKERAQPQEI